MGNKTSSASLASEEASASLRALAEASAYLASAEASAYFASAEASTHRWSYEVFLSFRGEDTRKGITSAIYERLQNMRGIKTFMDGHNVEVGDSISPTLLTAIKESRLAITVLSQHYASSTWCLEELTTIFEHMKDNNKILPLFYHVDPSDVRHQRGSFEDAFTKHESRHDTEKVKQWKDALTKVANLSGWDSNNYRSDKELVDDIVKLVWSKVLQVRIEDESTSRNFEVYGATKLAMDKVMNRLQDDEVAVIGLYGLGGVGKTTLVKHAGAQALVNGVFNKMIMAVVSQSVDLKKIQDQLADMLALNLKEHTKEDKATDMLALNLGERTEEEDRAVVLCNTILRGNKLLIILDDMWSQVPLSSIGIPSNDDLRRCNSKVLFTTRIRKVCQEMHSDTKINLNTLSEEDSLKLFMKKARLTSHELTRIYDVAREVAKNCAGIPVALVAVARALRDEDLDEWKKAAKRLQRSQPADPEDEKHVFNSIKFSYDYLKSTDAKACLLLCCLFPEDYDIPIEDIFRYGIGKGLFQESNTLQEARATAYLVVDALKASSLLLDSEEKGCVKMHDVIRDVVMSISSSEEGQQMFVKSGRRVTEWPRIDADINYSAISVFNTRIRKIPEEMVCSKLVQILSLYMSDFREFPETFFQSQNELRVLDLRNIDDIQELLKAFDLLTNLRVLFLYNNSKWSTRDLSLIGKLGKLEILSIRLFNSAFPKELGELSNLRLLDVRNAGHDMFPPQVISRLLNLEELYMKGKFIWGRRDQKNKDGNQTNLCCQEFLGLPNLNVLQVQIHDVECLPKVVEFNPNWVKFDIIINANKYTDHLQDLPQHERSLCLDTTINKLPNWFNKVVTERAEKLVYYKFDDYAVKNLLLEYRIGRLHGVKYLYLLKDVSSTLTVLIKTDTLEVPVFENLEELHVEGVSCEYLCAGSLPQGSFCDLKKLKVLTCKYMKSVLLSSDLLRALQNLEELLCVNLRDIEYVFGIGLMKPEEIICTKLRKIHVHYLWDLSCLWDSCYGLPLPHAMFQNLKSLKVGYCPTLTYVFPTISLARCFLQLEELYVYSCPRVYTVIRDSEADHDGMIEFPNLKILFLLNLYSLKTFYSSSDSSACPIINFPKLEQACFVGCSDSFHKEGTSSFRSLNTEVFKHFSKGKEFYNIDYNSTAHRLHEESEGLMYVVPKEKKDKYMLATKNRY